MTPDDLFIFMLAAFAAGIGLTLLVVRLLDGRGEPRAALTITHEGKSICYEGSVNEIFVMRRSNEHRGMTP